MPGPDFEEAVARLRAALSARAPRRLALQSFRPAAVLVALLRRPDGPALLFTRRADTLPHHRGEIAFPGGRLEPGETAEDAALRESAEEVGLSRDLAEPLGRFDDYPSIARFVVTPVVAAVHAPPPDWSPQRGEVDEVFEVPLARLLAPDVRRSTLWDPAQLPERIAAVIAEAAIPFEDVDPASGHWRVWSFHADPSRVVWGLTARILSDLLDRAFPPAG